MSATVSLTEIGVFTALRTVLLGWLPSGIECFKAQSNRVPEPEGSDYVEMTPVSRVRLSTNNTTFSDEFATVGPSTRTDGSGVQYGIQIDVHGPNSGDNAAIIVGLWRSDVATSAFAETDVDVTPLYCTEPTQLAFTDSEQQYEDRWKFEVYAQANIAITTSQQFFGTLTVNVGGASSGGNGIVETSATAAG